MSQALQAMVLAVMCREIWITDQFYTKYIRNLNQIHFGSDIYWSHSVTKELRTAYIRIARYFDEVNIN